MAKQIKRMLGSIANATYLAIFLAFLRRIVKKMVPPRDGRPRRYAVLLTTSPVGLVMGSFDTVDEAMAMIKALDDNCWGDDNVILDTLEGDAVFKGTNCGQWREIEIGSFAACSAERFEGSKEQLAELRGIAADFGQTRESTTYPGMPGIPRMSRA